MLAMDGRQVTGDKMYRNEEEDSTRPIIGIPPSQQAIRDKCFHPSGEFIEFKREEIEQSIPERFEQQVTKYPDRLAVKTKNHELTYDELNRAANRMARAILEQCGERQEPVALLFEQGASLIVALLGVLKAGKFYVPLGPSYPHARLNFMLADSQAGVMATNSKNFTMCKALTQHGHQILNIDTLGPGLSDENLDHVLSPDALAYIIYTSGATGQPKGVVHNHRNLLHLVMNYTNAIHICTDD